MSVKVYANIDTAAICRKYGLGTSDKARKALAANVRRRCDKYVPFDQGPLKNTAQVAANGTTSPISSPTHGGSTQSPTATRIAGDVVTGIVS